MLLSGVIYVGRDAAHLRIVRSLEKGEELPFDLKGQTIYYMGPSPAPPGRAIGAAGPTTSSRMDKFTPALLAAGLKAMVGKGNRSQAVRDAIQQYNAVYFVTYGGAGALLGKCIKQAEVIAYPELGAEALRRLEVVDFPAIVAYDAHGGDLFSQEKTKYQLA